MHGQRSNLSKRDSQNINVFCKVTGSST